MLIHEPQEHAARERAVQFLMSRLDYERALAMPYNPRDLSLDRTRDLLTRLGNPERALRIVHVAGTKGKGSTAALVAAMLTAGGFHAGLFSSPHLERIEERFVIDGEPIASAEMAALVERLRPHVEAMDEARAREGLSGATFFEITTAMAFVHFAEKKVDAAVIEVGLGGRLDSTNVVTPSVSVITSISYDHTRQLGNTLEQIAREKAGIIKPNVPVICGPIDESPLAEIEKIAAERNARVVKFGRDFSVEYEAVRGAAPRGRVRFKGFDWIGEGEAAVEMRLLGRHQANNAAVAVCAVGELRAQGIEVPWNAARAALERTISPARIEVMGTSPTVVLDAAHNVASARALVETLSESFADGGRWTLVFATTREKDGRGMLEALLPRFERAIFTKYVHNPRSIPPEELLEMARSISDREYSLEQDPLAACAGAIEGAETTDLVCVAGSFFLAAEVRPWLLEHLAQKQVTPPAPSRKAR